MENEQVKHGEVNKGGEACTRLWRFVEAVLTGREYEEVNKHR